MLTLDEAIERWAFWRINGECVAAGSYTTGERVQAGEVSVKNKPAPLIDDSVEGMVEAAVMSLSPSQKSVVVIEYRADSRLAHMQTQYHRAAAVSMNHRNYRSNLSKARLNLSIKTGFPRL